jgi:hypothetical protein
MVFNLEEGILGLDFRAMMSSGFFQSTLFRLTFFTAIILVYSLFFYYSYKLFSKKNLFNFNFNSYIDIAHPRLSSVLGFFVYLIEYLIILPFFVIIWFGFYSIFLLILARNLDIAAILLVSTSLIVVIRISSFMSRTLSQDLAKLLPFTLLALAITGERFFSIDLLAQRISEIPFLLSSFPIYLLFIFGVEFLLRFLDALKIFILKE